MIKPLHKSGDKKNPSNYRGIALLNIVSNLFSITGLQSGLKCTIESQFGFGRGKQTIDCAFILQALSQKHHCSRKPLYVCFIDYSTVFDTISHNRLWKKLAALGMSAKILTVLMNMYANACSSVKMNGELSPHLRCTRGLRQGCHLSPLLFNLFMADLEPYLCDRSCILGCKLQCNDNYPQPLIC